MPGRLSNKKRCGQKLKRGLGCSQAAASGKAEAEVEVELGKRWRVETKIPYRIGGRDSLFIFFLRTRTLVMDLRPDSVSLRRAFQYKSERLVAL